MLPEARLIRSEFTIRDLSLPEEVMLARKSLIRWIALSLGLISHNESRKLLLDVLEVIILFHIEKEAPTTTRIVERLIKLREKKPHIKSVYYHLLKLKENGILVRKKGRYYLWGEDWRPLKDVFKDLYLQKSEDIFKNIQQALRKLESSYSSSDG